MKELKDAKEIYNNIKIPDELQHIITKNINDHPEKIINLTNETKRRRSNFMIKKVGVAAAAVLLSFTAALNMSEAFAKGASELPLIGGVAKVLTIRSYHTVDGNKEVTVEIPEIEVEEDTNDTEEFVADVNAEIEEVVDTYLADAQSRLDADKEAFIATGGTEEEWAEKDLNIDVDYEVKYQKENILSLVLLVNESWYGAYDLKYFYNLNLKSNTNLKLKDFLGEDYVTVANDSITRQMKEKAEQDTNLVYWGVTENESGMTGFTTVSEDTKFYINENGKPVVCFDKYEVAPGFMGTQEFIIE